MASWNKLNGFVEHLAQKVHNLNTGRNQSRSEQHGARFGEHAADRRGIANCILGNVTQITYTNLSSRSFASVSATQTSGTLHLAAADLVLTSTGGTTGPFRYVYVWNDTPTSPADPLIGYWDYGSAITLNDGETLTIDLPSDILTLA
jgi:hypothetical protein